MEFSSAMYGAIAFSLFLYYYLLWSKSLKPKHNLPPEASGGRPIFGHLHLMEGGGRPPHFILAALADQHGPLFTIRLGAHRAVVVSSWKIAKELFTTHDVAVSSRPKMRAVKHLSYNFAMFGFSPYGSYWRGVRKLVNSELLSSSRVNQLIHVSVSEIAQSVKDLYILWEERKDKSSKQVSVEMQKWIEDLNFKMIVRVVAGRRFCGGGEDPAEMQQCRKVIRDFFELAGQYVAADALPWLSWLDLGGYEKRMKETAKELDEIVGRWLEEHRRNEDSGGNKAEDFMDVMVSAVRDSDQFDGQYDVDAIIKSTCQALILAATDTTSVPLIWALSLLLNNRHVLTKVQGELDEYVGTKRQAKESDIPNLVYLQAVVKETLRLYPPAPLGGPREFTQDCNVGGYHIPKGTWLTVNMWKLHRDAEVWPDDPLEFNPERFLTTHQNFDIKGQDFKLIPFGGGRRICAGLNLAMHVLHLVLANLLQAFDVATLCNECVDMTESAGLTNLKVTPLNVLVAPRLSPNLY